MLLMILSNIHALSVISLIFSVAALMFGFLIVSLESKPWDQAVKKLPANYFLSSILWAFLSAMTFCVTPSSLDIITLKLQG